MARRIHIFGASGSGATTLATVLCAVTNITSHDSDDFYFDLKYTSRRDPIRRNSDLFDAVSKTENWILSGSIDGWNSPVLVGDLF